MDDFAARVRQGDVRAIARLISRLENDYAGAAAPLRELYRCTGNAHVIGITGAPGSGKSTLVDGLVRQARDSGQTVAVLAVDPNSPFSGGAILGDRIRMQSHANDAGVFIRSMGARGQLGGLARAAHKAVHVLDSAGFGIVMVETVGVGQSELDIAGAADTTIVVVTPAMGDTVQTLKAGILEIADVFALNKADLDGSQQTFRALRGMLHMRPAHDWAVPIVETRGHEGVGLSELWSALQRHQTWLEETGRLTARRALRIRSEVLDLVERGLRSDVLPLLIASSQYEQVVSRVISRETDPDSGAEQILSGISTDPERIGSQ